MSAVPDSRTLLNIEDLMAVQAGTYQEAVRRFRATRPSSSVNISMVIPAYNEERRLLPTLLSIVEYFYQQGFSHEVIVVDDGSDDKTANLVRELGKRFHTIRLIRLPRNMGKGAAVRTGIRNATGNYVIYNDADGATPIGEIARLLAAIEQGADVAIGSRALYSPDTHVERKLRRFVAGRIFAFLVNALVVPRLGDTQCGFKMFRNHVAHRIFEFQQLDGFAFDIEVLRIAWLLGYSVVEVPVNWTDMRGSKVNLPRDSYRMFRDIFRVRYVTSTSLKRSNSRKLSQAIGASNESSSI
jgi:dolichyl-phosphate beta-glucosyltransferase